MDAIPCQLDMASADLLQLKLELDSCHKVEGKQGCCFGTAYAEPTLDYKCNI